MRLGLRRGTLLVRLTHALTDELKNYKLTRFSSERLLRFLTLLDRDVEIVIRPKAKRRGAGHLLVSVA